MDSEWVSESWRSAAGVAAAAWLAPPEMWGCADFKSTVLEVRRALAAAAAAGRGGQATAAGGSGWGAWGDAEVMLTTATRLLTS
eukprot:1191079-Prorocentrum_minimum.AAC.5